MINDEQRVEYAFNVSMLMSDVRLKTGKQSLRDIEAVTGVSAATLSRLDRGSMPDMETFTRLCARCQLEPGNYFDKQTWVLKKS